MTDHHLLVSEILVRYSVFREHQHDNHPTREAVGTLIYNVDNEAFVKISETHCRPATADEVETWDGPIAPWYKAKTTP